MISKIGMDLSLTISGPKIKPDERSTKKSNYNTQFYCNGYQHDTPDSDPKFVSKENDMFLLNYAKLCVRALEGSQRAGSE